MTTKGLYCPAGQFYIDPSRALKTQRILGELFPLLEQRHNGQFNKPIYCHFSATEITECYRKHGVPLAPTRCLSRVEYDRVLTGELFIVPHSFMKSEQGKLLGDLFPKNPDQLSLF